MNDVSSENRPQRASLFVKAALLSGVAAMVVIADYAFDLRAVLDPRRIEEWLTAAGALAPLAFVLLMAAAVVISPIPSLPLDIAAGSFFGPLLGTVYAILGALLGAVTSFLIARVLGRELVERVVGGHINFCGECSDRLLTTTVLISRLIPAVSFDVVSYGAGLTKMSLFRFVVATGIGMAPLTFLYVTVGAEVVANRSLAVVLAAALVALFFLVPRWIERHDFVGLRRFFEHLDDSSAH